VGVARRDFLRSASAISVGALAGVGAYGVAYERHRIERITRDLPVRGLPPALDGLRIGMITDVHHSSVVSAEDVTKAVVLLKEAAPDIVVLGGDYISFFDRSYIAPVAGSRPREYAGGDRSPCSAITTMRRCRRCWHRAASPITKSADLAHHQGRAPGSRRHPLLDPHAAWIAAVLKGTGGTAVLARSAPVGAGLTVFLDPLRRKSSAQGDVQVATLDALPDDGVPRKFPVLAGYATRDNTSIFVSRGVGTVYVPVRINCPPDIAILTLRTATS
jgi:hypothetical protein